VNNLVPGFSATLPTFLEYRCLQVKLLVFTYWEIYIFKVTSPKGWPNSLSSCQLYMRSLFHILISDLQFRWSIPYLKYQKYFEFWILSGFGIFAFVKEISWDGTPKLNIKFFYISYICVYIHIYTHSIKVILYNIFNTFVHETVLQCKIFYLWHHVSIQKVFGFRVFWIFGLEMPKLYYFKFFSQGVNLF
jgi:hypothetical protein